MYPCLVGCNKISKNNNNNKEMLTNTLIILKSKINNEYTNKGT